MSEGKSTSFEPIAVSAESTVVAEYMPQPASATGYQSEAQLEAEFIKVLKSQAYEHLPIKTEADLIANTRAQLETLNDIKFSNEEWERFFKERIAGEHEDVVEKTVRIQEDYVQLLKRDDGTTKNITLIDKKDINNNQLQVINQYEVSQGDGGAKYANRYDVTVLVNGLPLVHIELKRRGVDIREAFNQINRYERDSFWAGSGLFDYVQLFVISNGTLTKYYSNTTRRQHLQDTSQATSARKKTSNSFEFTSWWADATNKPIQDLTAFAPEHTCQAHAAEYPYPLLRTHRRQDAAGDASVPDRGDREDLAEDPDLDELQKARHSRGGRLCVAHHRLGQNADQLQGRPARHAHDGGREGSVCR